MAQHASFLPNLTNIEFDTVSANLVTQTKRMTNTQILDLADTLHDLIRSRQAMDRTFSRRQGMRVS